MDIMSILGLVVVIGTILFGILFDSEAGFVVDNLEIGRASCRERV